MYHDCAAYRCAPGADINGVCKFGNYAFPGSYCSEFVGYGMEVLHPTALVKEEVDYMGKGAMAALEAGKKVKKKTTTVSKKAIRAKAVEQEAKVPMSTKGFWKYAFPGVVGIFTDGYGSCWWLTHKDYLKKDPAEVKKWLRGKPADFFLKNKPDMALKRRKKIKVEQ